MFAGNQRYSYQSPGAGSHGQNIPANKMTPNCNSDEFDQSAHNPLSNQDDKIREIDNKVDCVDEKVAKLGQQMDLLLLHLGVGGNKSNGSVSPRDVRVCRASQADLKMVQGQSIETFSLQNGIVESDVIFTLAAAAEIRNSIQSPVDPRTGISVENARSEGSKTKGQFVASANRSSIPTNKTFPAAEQSPLKSKDTYNDGTMSNSDSSDSFDSSRNMSR